MIPIMAIRSVSSLSRHAQLKQTLIEKLVTGKKVIHYGCIDDDEPLIMRKFKAGYYLHKVVTDASEWAIGVDVNRKGISFLHNKLRMKNVVYGNVEDPGTFKLEKKKMRQADTVLIPDLIEHLSNPGNMLNGIKKNFSKDVKILLTTPNPFAWYNFVATLLNTEIYSPYHTMQFSAENMRILLKNNGLVVEKVTPIYVPKERSGVVKILDQAASNISVAISPGFADAYLYECSIQPKK